MACTIRLRKDDAEACLYLQVGPPDGSEPVTGERLRAAVEEAGCADWLLDEDAVEAAQQRLRQIDDALRERAASDANDGAGANDSAEAWQQAIGDGPTEFRIAECRDAEVHVEISGDKMKAYLRLVPPQGGNAANREQVLRALRSAGVRNGLREQLIEKALASEYGVQRLIAIGRAARDGEDSRFESLTATAHYIGPSIGENDVADLKSVIEFTVVEAGDALMRRYPATAGENGYMVTGEVLMARAGEQLEFDRELDGAEISPDDPDLLVASRQGHPVIIPCGVRVDPTLVVDNVDLTTGNIDFDGSLHVRGEVESGFEVRVSGDLVVGQAVGRATIEAGGSVQIGQGCAGAEPAGSGAELVYSTQVRCGTDFSARFISCAKLQAGGSVQAQEYISHCRVHADYVSVGVPQGKGIIQGGVVEARRGIVAKVFGSPGAPATELRAGQAAESAPEYQRLADHSDGCRQRLQRVADAFTVMGRKIKADGGLSRELEDQVRRLNFTKTYLEDLISADQAEMQRMQAGSGPDEVVIEAQTRVYPNVRIEMFGAALRERAERGQTRYLFREGEVRAG